MDIPIGESLEEAIETAAALVGFSRADDIAKTLLALAQDKNQQPDLAEAIDGLCDTIVVSYGAAVEMGVDLELFYDEVMRTNMAKVDGPMRADGKRLKPEGWQPPRILEMLEADVGARGRGR